MAQQGIHTQHARGGTALAGAPFLTSGLCSTGVSTAGGLKLPAAAPAATGSWRIPATSQCRRPGGETWRCWLAGACGPAAAAATFRSQQSSRRWVRTRWPALCFSASPSRSASSAEFSAARGRPPDRGSLPTSAAPAPASRACVHTGVVLLNIGTPASTDVEDVREYLARFLGDRKVVIDRPEAKRAALQGILQRAPKSAELYRKIWDPVRGSPLLYHTQDLTDGLQGTLGAGYKVCIGFQYSEPSVETAFADLLALDVEEIILVPMFPHFAEGTVGAILANTCMVGAQLGIGSRLRIIPPFYKSPTYLEAKAAHIRAHVGGGVASVDFVVFSFHGIPERQCTRTDDTQRVCMKVRGCCFRSCLATRNCYRAQCHETAKLLAHAVGLPEGRWSVAFQSRASLRGAIEWVKPYTDEVLASLPIEGKQRVAVCAPSFTADCIETLLEIGEDGKRSFLEAGGCEFQMIPCLNGSEGWVANLAKMIRDYPVQRGRGEGGGFWAM